MDERLEKHKVTKKEIPNLLDNFRILLQGYTHSVEKNDVIGKQEITQMAKYFKEKTGLSLILITRHGETLSD